MPSQPKSSAKRDRQNDSDADLSDVDGHQATKKKVRWDNADADSTSTSGEEDLDDDGSEAESSFSAKVRFDNESATLVLHTCFRFASPLHACSESKRYIARSLTQQLQI